MTTVLVVLLVMLPGAAFYVAEAMPWLAVALLLDTYACLVALKGQRV